MTWSKCGRCWSDHNADAGKAYYGGRVQVFSELGSVVGPIRSVDRNSMFPAEMYNQQYPDIEDVKRCKGNERILRELL